MLSGCKKTPLATSFWAYHAFHACLLLCVSIVWSWSEMSISTIPLLSQALSSMRCCSISSSKTYLKREGAATSFWLLAFLMISPAVRSLVISALVARQGLALEPAGLLVETEPLVEVVRAEALVSVFLLSGMVVAYTYTWSAMPSTRLLQLLLAQSMLPLMLEHQRCNAQRQELTGDVAVVVDGKEICLVRALYVYLLKRRDRAFLPRQILRQGSTTLLVILLPGSDLLV